MGLFSITHLDSVVRNVGLTLVNVTGNGEVGGLVGDSFWQCPAQLRHWQSDGRKSRGRALMGSQGSGEVSASFALGSVSGSDYIGGLTGLLSPAASISGKLRLGDGEWERPGGGLTPYNNGTISNSYASGDVTGASNVGGLVGYNSSASASTGIITNSYAVGVVSGRQQCWRPSGSGPPGLGKYRGKLLRRPYLRPVRQRRRRRQDHRGAHQPHRGHRHLRSWGVGDSPWEFGTSREYPVLKADLDGDGAATWQEFGYQRGVGAAVDNYRPVVGARQQIQTVLRDVVPSAGATYQWQRTFASGWRDVGPTSDAKGVKFDTPGGRTYRALVTLSPGVVLN